MLRVTIEDVPNGDEEQKETLEVIKIVNSGQHPEAPERGSYVCHHENGSFWIDDHKREDGYLRLIQLFLDKYLCGHEMTNEQKLHMALTTLQAIVSHERELRAEGKADTAVFTVAYTCLNMCDYLDKPLDDLTPYPLEKHTPKEWLNM